MITFKQMAILASDYVPHQIASQKQQFAVEPDASGNRIAVILDDALPNNVTPFDLTLDTPAL